MPPLALLPPDAVDPPVPCVLPPAPALPPVPVSIPELLVPHPLNNAPATMAPTRRPIVLKRFVIACLLFASCRFRTGSNPFRPSPEPAQSLCGLARANATRPQIPM